jgi:hypothetical protein
VVCLGGLSTGNGDLIAGVKHFTSDARTLDVIDGISFQRPDFLVTYVVARSQHEVGVRIPPLHLHKLPSQFDVACVVERQRMVR